MLNVDVVDFNDVVYVVDSKDTVDVVDFNDVVDSNYVVDIVDVNDIVDVFDSNGVVDIVDVTGVVDVVDSNDVVDVVDDNDVFMELTLRFQVPTLQYRELEGIGRFTNKGVFMKICECRAVSHLNLVDGRLGMVQSHHPPSNSLSLFLKVVLCNR